MKREGREGIARQKREGGVSFLDESGRASPDSERLAGGKFKIRALT